MTNRTGSDTQTVSSPARPLFKRRTYGWTVASLLWAVALAVLKSAGRDVWVLAAGLPATAFAAYVVYWTRLHPKIYLGKGLAIVALAANAVVTYVAFGELAQNAIWRRTFQLTDRLEDYRDEGGGWRVSYPRLWVHEEQRVSGSVIHTFKPSKITPTMFFTVATRPNVGTADLALVVESFFRNLPEGKGLQLLERSPVTLGGGRPGYVILYEESARRIPLKNETLFLLDGPQLFYATVSASPRWFDRHRDYLERLLFTLRPRD